MGRKTVKFSSSYAGIAIMNCEELHEVAVAYMYLPELGLQKTSQVNSESFMKEGLRHSYPFLEIY